MTNKIDGGAAFPQSGYAQWAPEGGMTLRDYFAAKAMKGILCGGKGIHSDQFMLSRDAYEVADAMLEARNK